MKKQNLKQFVCTDNSLDEQTMKFEFFLTIDND